MDGRLFLQVARVLAVEDDEASLRTAAGRAYYALFIEARDALMRWGLAPQTQFQVHVRVRELFDRTRVSDLSFIGDKLRELHILRNRADYENDQGSPFDSFFVIEEAIHDAESAIQLLLQIDGESARRDAAIAAIQRIP